MKYVKLAFVLPLSVSAFMAIDSIDPAWATVEPTANSMALFNAGAKCDSYDQWAQNAYRLLVGSKQAITAAYNNDNLPHLMLDKAYSLQLHEQADVRFATAPQRSTLDEGSAAGMVEFSTEDAGLYRVNISDGSWLDMVDSENQLIPAQAFHGRQQCTPLRKFVTYTLEANSKYRLQFSGGTLANLQLAVTRIDI